MTRTQNIKKNLIFNMIKYVTNLLLQFLLRTVLIYYMGAEYLGLNGLFTNIFSFLNLAELGIGSAIVFSMYKPIADGDTEKVGALEHLYKKFYMIIALVVGIVGLAITPFIKYFMSGGVTVDINIYVLYIMYLVYTLIGYFAAHKRSLLFAYQRNDVENKIKTICIIGMTIAQIVILMIFKNYYLYFGVSILSTLIECILIRIVADKMFPEIRGKAGTIDDATKKEITKNVTALSMHKIGSAVVYSTDNILISTFFGVVLLGAYSNYYLIISSLISVFTLLSNALLASVGNLIASSDSEYVYDKYKLISFIFAYLSAFCTICLVSLFQPFINKWTGGGEYLLEMSTVIIICVSFYLMRMRTAVSIFKDSAGLYWFNRWQPIIESVVNLVVSIILAKLMGINGIFIGTIISTVVAPLWWEPTVLYKHYFKKPLKEYFVRYIRDFVIMAISCTVTFLVCGLIPDGGVWLLIIKFAVCIVLSNILLIFAYLPTKDFRNCLAFGKGILNKLFKKNKKVVTEPTSDSVDSAIGETIDDKNGEELSNNDIEKNETKESQSTHKNID